MYRDSIYEFPLNERMRNFMRLENAFAQLAHFAERNCVWDSQASMLVLLDVLGIMERHDIKNEIAKELDRNIGILSNLLDEPIVNSTKLENTISELQTHLAAMQNVNGKVAKTLREDDLLSTIRQRVSLNSGINNFEIPSYYFWLNQTDTNRQQQIDDWLQDSIPVANAISLILDLLRESADFKPQTATAGFFQAPLSTQQLCQMLRIILPSAANYFPETSGNKHRVSIRFLAYPSTKQRPMQVNDDVAFNISYCGI